MPYFIVADSAFTIKDYLLKPFSHCTMDPRERMFNYRLSRARRVVENAFGIMAMHFRVFMRSIDTKMESTLLTIKAAATLHNVLSMRQPLPPSAFDREDAHG